MTTCDLNCINGGSCVFAAHGQACQCADGKVNPRVYPSLMYQLYFGSEMKVESSLYFGSVIKSRVAYILVV